MISPGPRTPEEAGCCVELIRAIGDSVPVLGVCLGHQAIGVAYGATVVRAPEVVHGKVGAVHHTGAGTMRGLDNPFPATRYHSLVISRDGFPDVLEVTAWSDDGLIMAVRHRDLPVEGVQFHPESIGTPSGHALLRNFLIAPARRFPHERWPAVRSQAIAQRKRAEVEQLRCAEAALWAKAESLPPARGLAAALRGGTIIAEMKRRSPSGGELRSDLDPATVSREYATRAVPPPSPCSPTGPISGARSTISRASAPRSTSPCCARTSRSIPCRSPRRRVAGADWVLLIVALLDIDTLDGVLRARAAAARTRSSRCTTTAEARHRVAAGAECIGINNRDLAHACAPTSRPSRGCAGRFRSGIAVHRGIRACARPTTPPASSARAPTPCWSARR